MSSKQEQVRSQIINKYLENPERSLKKLAKTMNVSYSTVKRTVSSYKKGLSTNRQEGSGRKKGPTDPNLAKQVKKLYQRNPTISERTVAEKLQTSKSQVQRVKQFYGLRSYKKQKVPDRTDEKEKAAKTRARKLYDQYLTKFDCVIMDDETYCHADFNQLTGPEFYTATMKDGVSPKFTQKKTSKYPKRFMIWQAICKCGLRSEEFVVKGTLNAAVYIDECLNRRLLPFIQQHGGSVLFWPDLATSHYAKTTMKWYQDNNVVVVPKDANPPNCPELRPIERYWALMKRALKKTKRTAKNEKAFRNNWRRAYTEVDESTVKKLMSNLNKKTRDFFSNH